MLSQKHIRVEIGNPLLTLLCDPKVAQAINNVRLNHLPEKIRVFCSQIGGTFVRQFIANSCLTKLIE